MLHACTHTHTHTRAHTLPCTPQSSLSLPLPPPLPLYRQTASIQQLSRRGCLLVRSRRCWQRNWSLRSRSRWSPTRGTTQWSLACTDRSRRPKTDCLQTLFRCPHTMHTDYTIFWPFPPQACMYVHSSANRCRGLRNLRERKWKGLRVIALLYTNFTVWLHNNSILCAIVVDHVQNHSSESAGDCARSDAFTQIVAIEKWYIQKIDLRWWSGRWLFTLIFSVSFVDDHDTVDDSGHCSVLAMFLIQVCNATHESTSRVVSESDMYSDLNNTS